MSGSFGVVYFWDMKTTTLLIILSLPLLTNGQQLDILSIPCDTVRMNEVSVQLYSAGHNQRNAVMWGLIGSVFTVLSADKAKVAKYSHNTTLAFGLITVGGAVALQLKSASHTRKAALLLRRDRL